MRSHSLRWSALEIAGAGNQTGGGESGNGGGGRMGPDGGEAGRVAGGLPLLGGSASTGLPRYGLILSIEIISSLLPKAIVTVLGPLSRIL